VDGYHLIAEEANRLVKLLPSSVVEAIAARLERDDGSDRGALRGRLAQAVPSPHHRALVTDFLDRWHSAAAGVSPQAVAAALLTARLAEQGHREGQTVELVWTGPDVGIVPLRRTEQVILQVIDAASARILVVSYAVFNIPRICEALVRAADRGVVITIVVEGSDHVEGKKAYSALAALGTTVASRCGVFVWPIEARFRGGSGKPGLLHVKCAVADGRWLFLSSANLTEYAFSINMELGLLVAGGRLPGQVEVHFDKMIQSGILAKA
jgi:phosphatidylserine/phosphatidylglycerophosphate/cardiolipin synthase-like enzyme